MQEWEAFNRIQPIGRQRDDFYFAYLMASIHNIAIAIHAKKGTKQFEIKEFLPNWLGEQEQKEAMTVDQMKQFWKDFAEKHNKTVRKNQAIDQRKPKNIT